MRAQCFKGYPANRKKFCVLSDVRADIKMFLLFFFSEKDGQFQDAVREFKVPQARHDYGHSLEEAATSLRS